jgi:methylenetetrahydrofolate dehydrogenase (NADP+) / methenyltetrahydrofolate cyclohydrolase
MAIIIDGKVIAKEITESISKEVALLKEKTGIIPCLSVILAGNNPASRVYVDRKKKACLKAGMESREYYFPEDCREEEILNIIEKLNEDEKVHGILVQLPLPEHLSQEKIIESVNPLKDVDCLHPVNIGKLFNEKPSYFPCTPHAIYFMLKKIGIEITGKHVVIVGRSKIVGKPMADILLRKNVGATVTVCHSKTVNLAHHTRQADILIVALGKPGFIKADMVKEGVVVIDVGINRIADSTAKSGTKLVGDVAFEEVSKKAYAIAPVPGGVGPVTIAMLLHNTLQSAGRF